MFILVAIYGEAKFDLSLMQDAKSDANAARLRV